MRAESSAASVSLADIVVRDLRADEVSAAVDVLARGMRDNPLHVAAYGDDPARRLCCHARVMAALYRFSRERQTICAVHHDRVLAVLGWAPPHGCQPNTAERLRFVPELLRLGVRPARALLRWTSAWADRDPAEAHVHVGPFAVDAPLQGRGIGSMLLREHCRRLDVMHDVAYLETDGADNVRLYQRFGYVVVAEACVLGVPNWFMRRRAGG